MVVECWIAPKLSAQGRRGQRQDGSGKQGTSHVGKHRGVEQRQGEDSTQVGIYTGGICQDQRRGVIISETATLLES